MPLYAYRCKECEYELEIRQSFSDDPLVDCPKCSKPALRKVINQVGVVFKGSGFYVNDSKSSNPAAPGNGSKSDSSSSSSSESKSSDSGSSSSSSSEGGSTKSESKSTTSSKSD
ncbi:MAG: FmdB family zinc ribbon protein [Chloroflexota bacterium]